MFVAIYVEEVLHTLVWIDHSDRYPPISIVHCRFSGVISLTKFVSRIIDKLSKDIFIIIQIQS